MSEICIINLTAGNPSNLLLSSHPQMRITTLRLMISSRNKKIWIYIGRFKTMSIVLICPKKVQLKSGWFFIFAAAEKVELGKCPRNLTVCKKEKDKKTQIMLMTSDKMSHAMRERENKAVDDMIRQKVSSCLTDPFFLHRGRLEDFLIFPFLFR